MANKKISELTTITGASVNDANDFLPIVDSSVNETKKITRSEFFKSVDTPITGTAVTQSSTDTTAGRLMKTGDFGLGTAVTLTSSDNLNALEAAGLYYNPTSGNASGNNYPITSAGAVINLRRTATNWSQIFISYAGNSAASDLRQFTRSYGNAGWSPWVETIHQGRIVGDVSQSGGVPTGAVIERGSNGNGEFIRFADGTQICLGAASSPSDGLGSTVSLPAAFVNTGYRVALAARDNFPRFGAAFSRTTTSFRAQTYTNSGGASTTSLDYIAIGRWF